MKRLQEIFAVGIRETWIVEIFFGNPGHTHEKNILEARLRARRHGYCIPTTTKARRNPEHIDFCWLLQMNRGFRMCPTRVIHNWTRTVSVKTNHPLVRSLFDFTACGKTKFSEGDGLQDVHNCFVVNAALAAWGSGFSS